MYVLDLADCTIAPWAGSRDRVWMSDGMECADHSLADAAYERAGQWFAMGDEMQTIFAPIAWNARAAARGLPLWDEQW